MFSSKDLFFTVPSGFRVSNSLRFRSSASAYLSRTPSSTTNRQIWTWSGWVKRGTLGTYQALFSCGTSSSADRAELSFNNDTIQFGVNISSTWYEPVTSQVFRDPSAWYHIVWATDTTQATAANRMKLYVNGVQVTAFSSSSYPNQNANTPINVSGTQMSIGYYSPGPSAYFDGYLAQVNFIDGQALTPSSFGAYDTDGIWQPTAYSGSGYGTNGFYLPFSNTTSTTTLVADSSGNGNNWTPNNISLTAGTTYDSMIDSPTNYADGGNGRGNYAVLNPIAASGFSGAAQNGNLTANGSGGAGVLCATIGMTTGKWYAEVICVAVGDESSVGISATAMGFANNYVGGTSTSWGYYVNGNKYTNSSASAYGASWTTNDTIGIAFDADAGTLVFYKNGSTQGTAFTGLNSGPYYFAVEARSATPNNCAINFGQRPFVYSNYGTDRPAATFLALNTQNLTAPTIANGAQYMAAVLYTGTGSSQTITASSTNSGNNPNGTTFQPDLVWVKGRSGATDHAWYDVVRGVQKQLESNTTTAETTETTGLTAFTSSGFTTGALAQMNTNTATYVAWEWIAGGTGVSNTSGSITSTVSANTTAGFSVVTYTGTLSAAGNATVGHGLGVTPSLIISKSRSAAADWCVQIPFIAQNKYLVLNTTVAQQDSVSQGGGTLPLPTSTTFGTSYINGLNINGQTFVAYCFAPVAGYSAFGSYTGNGSTDGPFVYTGFRPRWIMLKPTVGTGSWIILDTSRDTYNVEGNLLWANETTAETASPPRIDGLSNGFKVRAGSGSAPNVSSEVYIYAAFAENPFKISRAR